MKSTASAGRGPLLVALAGNPNSGKTTVFNALTGLRHKVGNYPGVTVEWKTGSIRAMGGAEVELLDLPGAYSLNSRSPDEEIARSVILGEQEEVGRPDLVIVVADASNLERNLYLAAQILEMGAPALLALNMMDVAERLGTRIRVTALEEALGVTVIPIVANRGTGIDLLRAAIPGAASTRREKRARPWRLEPAIEDQIEVISRLLESGGSMTRPSADAEALRLLGPEGTRDRLLSRGGEALAAAVGKGREALRAAGLDPSTFEAEERYRWIKAVVRASVETRPPAATPEHYRADAVLTHRLLGPLIFLAILGVTFYAVFAWAAWPMEWIDRGVLGLGRVLEHLIPPGALRSLLVDGVLSGAGSVMIFLPQIMLLFLFLSILEDTGYLARAAFMMDRVMRQFGFSGKACIPLMSCFACAIPGIMAARTIESRKDRMVTIMAAPFMSCSARLPIYTLVIGAFVPGGAWTHGLVMTALYLLGMLVAVAVATVLTRTVFRGGTLPLIMELPPYRRPHARTVLVNMLDRARLFVTNAGTVILAVSVILWFLASYPRVLHVLPSAGSVAAADATPPAGATPGHGPRVLPDDSAQAIRESFAGRIGRAIEPAIAPLGFDWKIGIGLVSSFAAREVFVSTMGTVYGVGDADRDPTPLADHLRAATWDSGPRRGRPIYTLPVALALLVFYVLACQCASTLAVVKRETNSWRWPIFMWTYMTVLAYTGAWITYRVTGFFSS